MAGDLTQICIGEYNETHNTSSDSEANEYMGVGDVKGYGKERVSGRSSKRKNVS